MFSIILLLKENVFLIMIIRKIYSILLELILVMVSIISLGIIHMPR